MIADISIKQGDGSLLPITFRGERLEMYVVERFINEPERIAIHIFCGAGGDVQSAFPVAGRIMAEVTPDEALDRRAEAAPTSVECEPKQVACADAICQLVGWHTDHCKAARATLSKPTTGAAREADV